MRSKIFLNEDLFRVAGFVGFKLESGSKYFIADSSSLESSGDDSIDWYSFPVFLGAEPMDVIKVLQAG